MKLHPATKRKLANHLAWKLVHITTFEVGSTDRIAQHGWYNGFVSCLYTQYGIKEGDTIVDLAHEIVARGEVKEVV